MSYDVRIPRNIRRVIEDFGISDRNLVAILDKMESDLAENPFDLLIRINSSSEKIYEYSTKIQQDGSTIILGFWLEHYTTESKHVLLAVDAFNLTLRKVPTGKHLPVAERQKADAPPKG